MSPEKAGRRSISGRTSTIRSRKLAELAVYNPEQAIKVGQELLRTAPATLKKALIDELERISDAASSRFLYTDKRRFRRLYDLHDRFLYMKNSGDYAELRSVKEATPDEIVKLMLSVYKRKKHYSEANLEPRSLFSIELFARHLSRSSFHDITVKDIEHAVMKSRAFVHERNKRGLYVKPK